MSNFEEYQDLGDTGYQGGKAEQVAPEDEFFHSVYVSGKNRKNHINITEQIGNFQVRGVEYNLNEVYMVITHTKDLLAKITQSQGRDNIECFSYKDGAAPWFGTVPMPDGSKRVCPLTSAERAANPFCNVCRTQIIVGGIYCNVNGSPILTDEKKPIFIFIRGKGLRYSNVSEYLNDRFNEDLTPIFEPVTEQSKSFEKKVVNNKRCVTKITQKVTQSSFGNDVYIFVLDKGIEIPKEAVLKILKLSKDTLVKFNDKFDWSTRKQTASYTAPAEGVLEIGDPGDKTVDKTADKPAEQAPANETSTGQQEKTFSFDDIVF